MNNNHLQTVQQHYPDAKPTEDVVNEVLSTAKNEYHLSPKQIIYADSFCSDEVNDMQFPPNNMNGAFKLGGLGGYPFTGLTGMGAFAAHVSEENAALIFFGPHIGITNDGKVGAIKRIGQYHSTDCCGSVSAALSKLLHDNIQKDEVNHDDYQQKTIERILMKEKGRIQKADSKIMEAAEVLFEAINKKNEELRDQTVFNCKCIIQCGGIFINSDKKTSSFWAPRRFDILEL